MPELPSVEIFKNYFDTYGLNQNIAEVKVFNPEILGDINSKNFKSILNNQRFISNLRYGKYLFSSFNRKAYLILHFGMTGYLRYHQLDDPPHKHQRVSFIFDNGKILSFIDPRKFGKVDITFNWNHFIKQKKLGPDALRLDYEAFHKLFKNRKGAIKPLLMNQQFIAGIGNLYADEILYQSGLHPLTKACHLKNDEIKQLYENMKMVLEKAITVQDQLQNFPEDYLLAHRYKGGECPEGGIIKIIRVGGRTTYLCPSRQKKII